MHGAGGAREVAHVAGAEQQRGVATASTLVDVHELRAHVRQFGITTLFERGHPGRPSHSVTAGRWLPRLQPDERPPVRRSRSISSCSEVTEQGAGLRGQLLGLALKSLDAIVDTLCPRVRPRRLSASMATLVANSRAIGTNTSRESGPCRARHREPTEFALRDACWRKCSKVREL
jgi:hypothetical protein